MPEKRFDHLIKKLLDAHLQLNYHARLVESHRREFRRDAYRFAQSLMEVRKEHHNEFIDWVHSHGVDLDEWLDSHFAPIEALGESRKRLMEAIESGMSEREYVRQGITLWIHNQALEGSRRVKSADDSSRSVVADELPESMPVSEQLDYYKKAFEETRAELKLVNKDNRELRREVARMLRRLNSLVKIADEVLPG